LRELWPRFPLLCLLTVADECSRVAVSSLDARSGISQPSMATTLAPVENREVVRCDDCHLVQFKTANNLCRRCRASLDEDEPEPILTPVVSSPEVDESDRSEVQVAKAIRSLRQRCGLSQRQLAMRMGVPRTYVSKIENEKATPTLSSLERLARALEVTVPDLLHECGPSREDDVRQLMTDPFIVELMEFTSQLNAMQLSSVLTQVRDMVTHPRRGA
jgi:transcriptional regulator with XRE-family HTH domain